MGWSRLVKVFEFGKTARLVESDEASLTVQKVENLLDDSMKILKSHEPLINAHEYSAFSLLHRRLLLRVIEFKQGAVNQETENLLSASPAGRQKNTSDRDLAALHAHARVFYRDVVTTSHRAQALEDQEAGLDALGESSSNSELRTWYSFVIPQSDASENDPSDASASGSEPSAPFLTVAHIRENSGTSDSNPQDETYRRILIMENERKRILMIDPNLRHLGEGSEALNESSLLELSRAGETLFKATNPEDLEGYRMMAAQQEPSWVDSMINSIAQLGVGIGGRMM